MEKTFKVFLLCALCLINCFLYGITSELSTQRAMLNDLMLISEKQTEDVCSLIDSTATLHEDIDTIYQLLRDHEDCTALAMFLNMDQVLAEQYGRSVEEQDALYSDDSKYSNFYGRLYIPDAKVDVALYRGNSQGITDRKDSANIFTWITGIGEIIADHNNQEFAKLFSVEKGMLGYIQLEDGTIINIECVDIIDGHNTGYELLDSDKIDATGKTDYLMYTCRNGWYNIRIWYWNKI